jgi:hypothetical protein
VRDANLDELANTRMADLAQVRDNDYLKVAASSLEAIPDKLSTATAFRKNGGKFQDHSKHTPHWHFSFAFTGVTKLVEEYQADVGFSCGTSVTNSVCAEGRL